MKKVKVKAFTLAEVLITLGIIGVVATMTIPTLVSEYKKNYYVTALKNFYSQFNQGLAMLATDYSCSGDLACTGLFSSTATDQELGDAVVKYFKVIKNCGVSSDASCFASRVNLNYDSSVYIPTGSGWNVTSRYRFITTDGVSVLFSKNSATSDCTSTVVSGDGTCGSLYVDINGLKGPNLEGRDIFCFYILKSGTLYPIGASRSTVKWSDVNRCPDSSYVEGIWCTGRIFDEGWEMNY